MQLLGKFLQHVGLVLPPLGMVLQLTNSINLGQMLLFLVTGVLAFLVGRMIEGYSAG